MSKQAENVPFPPACPVCHVKTAMWSCVRCEMQLCSMACADKHDCPVVSALVRWRKGELTEEQTVDEIAALLNGGQVPAVIPNRVSIILKEYMEETYGRGKGGV